MSGLSGTKKTCGRVHTQLSELIKDKENSENGISMLVNQNSKQREKIDPARIYLENFSAYNQMKNEDIFIYVS